MTTPEQLDAAALEAEQKAALCFAHARQRRDSADYFTTAGVKHNADAEKLHALAERARQRDGAKQ